MVTPAPTPTPVLMLNLTPSPIRLRKNLLDSGPAPDPTLAPEHLCRRSEMYRSRSRSRSQANFFGAGLDSELSLTSKLE